MNRKTVWEMIENCETVEDTKAVHGNLQQALSIKKSLWYSRGGIDARKKNAFNWVDAYFPQGAPESVSEVVVEEPAPIVLPSPVEDVREPLVGVYRGEELVDVLPHSKCLRKFRQLLKVLDRPASSQGHYFKSHEEVK